MTSETRREPEQAHSSFWKNLWEIVKIASVPLSLISGISMVITGLLTKPTMVFFTIALGLFLFTIILSMVFLVTYRGKFPQGKLLWYFVISWLSTGLIIGIIASFAMFKPNRDFFVDSYLGIKTPTATTTFTMTPSPSAITASILPSSTPDLIFQDNFSQFDLTHWRKPDSRWESLVQTTAAGRKLKIDVNCPTSDQYTLCNPYVTLYQPQLKDFDLSYDFIFDDLSSSSTVTSLETIFRYDGSNFYAINIDSQGNFKFILYTSATNGFTTLYGPVKLPETPEIGKVINIRIVADGEYFLVYKDGSQIMSEIDGNIRLPGMFLFMVPVPQGNSASIIIQKLKIYLVH